MSKKLIIIPTYDEKDNVGPIAQAVHQHCYDADVLFVDDNSPDGTGQIIDELCKENSFIHVLHRKEKNGLGRAYIAGFKWAIEKTIHLKLKTNWLMSLLKHKKIFIKQTILIKAGMSIVID